MTGQAKDAPHREWVAEPQQPSDTIVEATGRDWNEWVDLIDSAPGRKAGHTAIAKWLVDEQGVDAWWAQSVTVGYERITGLRLPGQLPDGSFSVSRSRTIAVERNALRALLLDDGARAELLPGFDTALRSKPASKALRFNFGRDGESLGSVVFSLDPAPAGRLRLTVTHEKLDSVESGERWKGFWSEWLATVEDVSAGR